MNGFLVVDKPAGMTSHDVIARLRRALNERRIGHAGTLDPPATGVLLIGVGRGARLLRFLEAHEKEYVAGVTFGVRTSTQDATGEVLDERDASSLDEQQVRDAFARFVGEIEQVPPMVSAVKVGGERLYQKARRGEEIERRARRVTVSAAEVASFEPGTRATATVRTVCSRGTYVRTLAADAGDALGVGAHLTSLRRTRIGAFGLAEAVPLDEVVATSVRPMEDAVSGYPRHEVGEADARAIVHGRRPRAAGIAGSYAVFGPAGLVAMAEDAGGELRTLCVVSGS